MVTIGSGETTLPVGLVDIESARVGLNGVIYHTPLVPWEASCAHDLPSSPTDAAASIWLKPESLQRTGSFKIRGAYTKIAALSAAQRANGVISYSSGNHGQGVACAASLLGTRAIIVMPEDAIPAKVEGARAFGAEVRFCGTDSTQRMREAERLAAEHGYALVPPYDDPLIIAGQGTIGLEILDDLPDDAMPVVVVPIGGGGLIAGVSLAVKSRRPMARIIGVEPETAADAQASLQAGAIQDIPPTRTIADGLRARHIGGLNFAVMQRYVDRIVTVSDEQILHAVTCLRRRRLIVEPSGAVGVAALCSGALQSAIAAAAHNGPLAVVIVLSGGNIDSTLLGQLL